MGQRERLIARIQQIRSAFTEPAAVSPSRVEQDQTRALEARVAHLEQLVEGLQDSVHRESTRLSKRVGELEARIRPAALSKALSDDARDRGL
jgi:hypothetical protein